MSGPAPLGSEPAGPDLSWSHLVLRQAGQVGVLCCVNIKNAMLKLVRMESEVNRQSSPC